MTHPIQTAPADHAPGYKVDISRGQRIGRVSSEWFSRPEDERYLSLNELFDAVRARSTEGLSMQARAFVMTKLASGGAG